MFPVMLMSLPVWSHVLSGDMMSLPDWSHVLSGGLSPGSLLQGGVWLWGICLQGVGTDLLVAATEVGGMHPTGVYFCLLLMLTIIYSIHLLIFSTPIHLLCY